MKCLLKLGQKVLAMREGMSLSNFEVGEEVEYRYVLYQLHPLKGPAHSKNENGKTLVQ